MLWHSYKHYLYDEQVPTGIGFWFRVLKVHLVLECELQERHSDVKAVLRLPEIRCPWVRIHIRRDLQCARVMRAEEDIAAIIVQRF
jgi:hypothetical protein